MACVTAPHDQDRVAASSKPLLRSACRIVPGVTSPSNWVYSAGEGTATV